MSRIYFYRHWDDWYSKQNVRTALIIRKEIAKMELGNMSNCKVLGKGVHEKKINIDGGLRIYFAFQEYDKDETNIVLLLLGGGTKRRQSNDIKKAQESWAKYKKEKKAEDSNKIINLTEYREKKSRKKTD